MRLTRRLAPFRDLVLVIATASLASTTISLGFPLLSLVLERHGHDALTIGLNSAASGLAVFLVAPLLGVLVRGLGAVRTMAGALIVSALLFLLLPVLVDPFVWFGLRILLGAAGAVLFILSEAGVNALCPPALRGRVIAAYATAFSVGYAAGPLLLALAGGEGWLPFVLASLLLLASIPPLLAIRALDAALVAPPRSHRRHGFVRLVRAAPLPFVGVLVYALIETAFFALLPVYALRLGLTEAAAATLLGVWIAGNILFQIPLGWLADRWSRSRVAGMCAAVSTLLLLAVPALAGGAAVWGLFLVMGGAMGALYAMSLGRLGDCFAAADLTRANTAFVMAFQVGLLIGPAAVGAAMRAFVPDAFVVTLALPLLVLLAACLAAPARPGPPRATVPA